MASRCLSSWLESKEAVKPHWGIWEHCVQIPTWVTWGEAERSLHPLLPLHSFLSVVHFIVQKLRNICLFYPFLSCFLSCGSLRYTGGKSSVL